MARRGVLQITSLILFHLLITGVVITLTSLVKNSSSELFSANHKVSSIETNTTRNKRFVVETGLIVKGIGIAVQLTALVVSNVKQSFDKSQAQKDHKELINHFQRIESELEEQKEDLQSINREIKSLGLSVGYSQHEVKIKNSLLALHQYLEHPDERNRDIFTNEASQLSQSLIAVVNGLLGQNAFDPDIMSVLRDAIGCHGRRLHKKIKPILSIVMTGLWVRGEYQRIRNVSEPDSSHFKNFIMTSTPKLTKRLDDMAVECQANEENVVQEMRNIIKTKPVRDNKELAESFLEFLQDKYDTKKWIVVVLPDIVTTAGKSLELLSENKVHFTQSGKFHTVSVEGTFMAAISVDPSAIDSMKFVDIYLKKFQIPIHTSAQYGMTTILQRAQGYRKRWNRRLLFIHENLHLFLTPLRKRVIIESLVTEIPCISSINEFEELVTIVGSNGTEWRRKSDEFDDYGKHNGWCIDPLVIVVPVKSSASNSASCENQEAETSGLLRNDFGQAYLSVQGDSDGDGAYIILDREWRNNSGQRWRFVNNQLMNDFGKCLTVSTLSSFLYQKNCNFSSTAYNRMRQTWRRTGLQIVTNNINPLKARLLNDLCLAFSGEKNDETMYAILGKCDFTPQFLWYDWDLDCEDVMNDSETNTNGSRALRNEFSRRYLSVYETGNYLHHRAWINHPGQNWKFIHGQLRNGFGKCLEGKGWYALQVECDGTGKAKRWTYNEKRQIVSGEGYCLSVGDKKDYVVYDHCQDDPEHRWY